MQANARQTLAQYPHKHPLIEFRRRHPFRKVPRHDFPHQLHQAPKRVLLVQSRQQQKRRDRVHRLHVPDLRFVRHERQQHSLQRVPILRSRLAQIQRVSKRAADARQILINLPRRLRAVRLLVPSQIHQRAIVPRVRLPHPSRRAPRPRLASRRVVRVSRVRFVRHRAIRFDAIRPPSSLVPRPSRAIDARDRRARSTLARVRLARLARARLARPARRPNESTRPSLGRLGRDDPSRTRRRATRRRRAHTATRARRRTTTNDVRDARARDGERRRARDGEKRRDASRDDGERRFEFSEANERRARCFERARRDETCRRRSWGGYRSRAWRWWRCAWSRR